jgi:hypothetical protein
MQRRRLYRSTTDKRLAGHAVRPAAVDPRVPGRERFDDLRAAGNLHVDGDGRLAAAFLAALRIV